MPRTKIDLLHLLFKTATETLQEIFRDRLNLPDGKLGAIAAVHTFGDYLIFHPHLHVLAADGLFTPDGRFHRMPAEDLAPAIELFRHRFLQALRDGKHISPSRLADLLSWKHSGFNIHDGGEKPVPSHDTEGRKGLAEYLLRHPFSLQKITWNPTTQTVIYGSKRHHTTKRNFEIFKAPDFIAAVIDHLPPKGTQTVRYYGLYSNKTRGQQPLIPDRIIPTSSNQQSSINNHQSEILLIPVPPKQSARSMRPLWRDMILKHPKSIWTTAASWFSNTPDMQAAHLPKNRRQKKSGTAVRRASLIANENRSEISRVSRLPARTGDFSYLNTAH